MAFEDLELHLSVTGEATTKLDSVSTKLNEIKTQALNITKSLTDAFKNIKLPNLNSNNVKPNISNAKIKVSTIQESAETPTVAQELQQSATQAQTAVEGLTKEQLNHNNALIRAQQAQNAYNNAVGQSNKAIQTQQEEIAKLNELLSKQSRFNELSIKGEKGQLTAEEEKEYVSFFNGKDFGESPDFTAEIESQQKKVDKANKAVEQSSHSLSTTYARQQIAQNNVAKSAKNLDEQLKKNKISLKSIISKAVGAITVIRQLSTGFGIAIKASSDFNESLNLFGVTFGENYKETVNWALDFADNLGIAQSEVIEFTGLFKQLATSIGIVGDIGTEMSTTLTSLAYDLASLYDIETESAMEKLQAGIFSGQTKPLRSLGLDVTSQTLDNLLKTNEAFKDIGVTSSKALLQSDKAMLRLIAVLQNGRNAFGDMQKTVDSLGNTIRIFQGSIKNFSTAIGDALSEPFKNVLQYINGFILGITKVIRAFFPVKDTAQAAAAGMQQFADDTEDANDATEKSSKLDIDEFRTLNSGKNEQVNASEIITAELERQMQLYQDQLSAVSDISNKATEIAEKIFDWFIDIDENGMPELSDEFKTVVSAVSGLVAIPLVNWLYNGIEGIVKFTNSLITMKDATNSAAISYKNWSTVLRSTGIFAVIYAVTELIQKWDDLSNGARAVLIIIGALGLAFIGLSVYCDIMATKTMAAFVKTADTAKLSCGTINGALGSVATTATATAATTSNGLKTVRTSLMKTESSVNPVTKSFSGLSVAIGAIAAVGLYVGLTSFLNSLNGKAKLITSVAVAVVGLAVAIGAAVAASHGLAAPIASTVILGAMGAILAGAGGIISSIQGFAEGGITDANLIMTHENGVREWVGKQGHSTAVVNDTQMSSVMSQSVRDGLLEAMSYGVGNNQPIDVTVQAVLDGQKIYESTKRIARKNGQKFANV